MLPHLHSISSSSPSPRYPSVAPSGILHLVSHLFINNSVKVAANLVFSSPLFPPTTGGLEWNGMRERTGEKWRASIERKNEQTCRSRTPLRSENTVRAFRFSILSLQGASEAVHGHRDPKAGGGKGSSHFSRLPPRLNELIMIPYSCSLLWRGRMGIDVDGESKSCSCVSMEVGELESRGGGKKRGWGKRRRAIHTHTHTQRQRHVTHPAFTITNQLSIRKEMKLFSTSESRQSPSIAFVPVSPLQDPSPTSPLTLTSI